jgi:carbonic anhydrase
VLVDRRSFIVTGGLAAAGLLVAGTAASADVPHQSPVDIRTRAAVRDPRLPPLEVQYPRTVDLDVRYVSRDPADDPSGCGSRGREETIEAAVTAGAAWVALGGTRYDLLQFHFHSPSEHMVDGRRAPLEQHFVHAGPSGEKLVVGLLLEGGGRRDSDVDQVLRTLPVECGEHVEVAGVDLAQALPRDLATFRYTGSLTTAPYSEPVSWLVLRQHGRISDETLARFRGEFPDGDARDPQPLNGRVVKLVDQHR